MPKMWLNEVEEPLDSEVLVLPGRALEIAMDSIIQGFLNLELSLNPEG